MRPELRKVPWIILVFFAVGVGVIALVTSEWVHATPPDPMELTPGGGRSLRTWAHLGIGSAAGLGMLVLAGYFAVLFVRELQFARRATHPLGTGDDADPALHAVEGSVLPHVRSVLFVSPRGIGRSRIAAAYLEVLTGGGYWIAAAAAMPVTGAVSHADRQSLMIATLGEHLPIDPQAEPRVLTAALVRRADLVVRIGHRGTVPVRRGIPVQDWDVPDPVGADIGASWRIREDIKRRVEDLGVELGLGRRSLSLRDRPIPGQPQMLAAGRATIPRPELPDTEAGRQFAAAEARLLVQVVDAPSRASEINGRGSLAPGFAVPWVVSAGAAASAIARELEWRAIGGSHAIDLAEESMGPVIAWLVGARALRPLTDEQLDALVASGRAQREHDDPSDEWPRGLAGEYPVFAEQRFVEEDRALWEVVPGEMLRVYPDLDVASDAWAAAAHAAGADGGRR